MKEPILSLLQKLQDLEEFISDFYKNLSQNDRIKENITLKNTASILAIEEKRHEKLLQDLIGKLDNVEAVIVDKELLARADYYLVTMKQALSSFGILTANQLIALAIDWENKQVFLLSQILDMLREEEAPEYIQEAFQLLFDEEKKHYENLMPYNGK